MFTGIIEAVGSLTSIDRKGEDCRITIATNGLDMSDVKLGDSIATNGVCLTVVDMGNDYYSADVSAETVRLTGFADYQSGSKVNLEKAMQVGGRLGGHIVSGHVDGMGVVDEIIDHTDYIEIWVKAQDDLAKYIAHKGSITVDGASLTVNKVDGARFMLWIIPHTVKETVIGTYKAGTRVNLEVDLIARYLERLLLCEKAAQPSSSKITEAFLAEHGYLK